MKKNWELNKRAMGKGGEKAAGGRWSHKQNN